MNLQGIYQSYFLFSVTWKYVCPILCGFFFFVEIYLNLENGKKWITSGYFLSTGIESIISLIGLFIASWVPIVACYRMCQLRTGLSCHSLKALTRPCKDWGHLK